jgi:hypothetical protein
MRIWLYSAATASTPVNAMYNTAIQNNKQGQTVLAANKMMPSSAEQLQHTCLLPARKLNKTRGGGAIARVHYRRTVALVYG